MLSKQVALDKATEALERSKYLYTSYSTSTGPGEIALAAAKAAEVWVQIANAVDSTGK